MAQRRMFSPDIVESDAFLEMPPTAQNLYFHLGMYADDDGFVNPRKIERLLGSAGDDLKILATKRFVMPFKSGVIVIKHWRVNNLVRKDWYRPTQYIEEKGMLYLKENGAYTEDSGQGTPLVNDSLTVRTRRIDQDRIESGKADALQGVYILEGKEDEEPRVKAKPKYPHAKEVFGWFPNPQKSWALNTTELKHAELLWERGQLAVVGILQYLVSHKDDSFLPKVTKPSDLERKWADIEAYDDKQKV